MVCTLHAKDVYQALCSHLQELRFFIKNRPHWIVVKVEQQFPGNGIAWKNARLGKNAKEEMGRTDEPNFGSQTDHGLHSSTQILKDGKVFTQKLAGSCVLVVLICLAFFFSIPRGARSWGQLSSRAGRGASTR